jgi:hypothetical protein
MKAQARMAFPAMRRINSAQLVLITKGRTSLNSSSDQAKAAPAAAMDCSADMYRITQRPQL